MKVKGWRAGEFPGVKDSGSGPISVTTNLQNLGLSKRHMLDSARTAFCSFLRSAFCVLRTATPVS